jgi:hypothetical protein
MLGINLQSSKILDNHKIFLLYFWHLIDNKLPFNSILPESWHLASRYRDYIEDYMYDFPQPSYMLMNQNGRNGVDLPIRLTNIAFDNTIDTPLNRLGIR